MTRTLKPWLPVVLWMGFIFVMSTGVGAAEHTSRFLGPALGWLFPHLSAAGIAELHHWVRKAGHLTEYAILAGLVFRALRRTSLSNGSPGYRLALVAWTISSAYAATDEFHQLFVAGRTPGLGDVAIDALGAALAVGGATLWRKWRAIRRHRHQPE